MRTQNDGFALLMSLFVLTGLAMLINVGVTRSMTELLAGQRYVATQQAFHLAEAGVDEALVTLQAFLDTNGSLPNQLLSGDTTLSTGRGTFTITPHQDPVNPFITYFTIQTKSSIGSVTLTYELRTESFSRYAYFTNAETMADGTPVWFNRGSVIEGPLHTNGQLNISFNPVFKGPVTSVHELIHYKHGGPPVDNPDFQQGEHRGVERIKMPTSMTVLKSAASSQGLRLSGSTTLQITGTTFGTTLWITNADRGWVNHPEPLPVNGVVFVDGDVTLSSILLNGRATIGSSGSIALTDQIAYHCDPETLLPESLVPPDADCFEPGSEEAVYNDDLLGLVAKQDIEVSASAPSDISIQASLMAVDGSFRVDGCETVESCSQIPLEGTLHVFGGIIQKNRGVVGTFSGISGVRQSGYEKHYHYDTRLRNISPPAYPTTGRLEAVIWKEE